MRANDTLSFRRYLAAIREAYASGSVQPRAPDRLATVLGGPARPFGATPSAARSPLRVRRHDRGGRDGMAQLLRCCNDTYVRDLDGIWRYPWGDPVPGATDLTLADLMALDRGAGGPGMLDGFRALSPPERDWLAGRHHDMEEVLVRHRASGRRDAGDLIVGMSAPELHVLTMMTVGDVAAAAGVSKATIDSYRYRGYLPQPQVTRGRTPLWARPIVHRWLATRPGCGWRSDVYGRTDVLRGTDGVDPGPGEAPSRSAATRRGFRVA